MTLVVMQEGGNRQPTGTEHRLFYYPYASFTNAQLPLLNVAALWFDKVVILDPVGASWDTVGADDHARDAVQLLKDARTLEIVNPATVLARYKAPIAAAVRRDMGDREFLERNESQNDCLTGATAGRASRKAVCTIC